MEAGQLTLSKMDAATRQLETAIKLYFNSNVFAATVTLSLESFSIYCA
jgi:hypothetical protein